MQLDKIIPRLRAHYKTLLPRRESERQKAPLAQYAIQSGFSNMRFYMRNHTYYFHFSHMDVLHSLETRHSLLGYTYKKYMDAGHCPFVPGKVLDEFYRVLRLLRTSNRLPYPHEVLKELRDLCSVCLSPAALALTLITVSRILKKRYTLLHVTRTLYGFVLTYT